ncbi:hypothetical protein ACFV20_29415 [Streptomyces sp. NPDC059696]|uniref:hypothetical protein n=1 Tax=Streptomyces sp. NPDC059696 TaxID=3346911 RepID=UPI0036A7F7E8
MSSIVPLVGRGNRNGRHYNLTTAEGPLRSPVVTSGDARRRFRYRAVEGMAQSIDFHLGTIDVPCGR